MKNTRRFYSGLAIAAAVTGMFLAMAVPAGATATMKDTNVEALIDKAFAGTITANEKSILINNYPEIAAVIPDIPGASSGDMRQEIDSTAREAGPVRGTNCYVYSGWNTFKSLLGFTIYRFDHKATVCSDGAKITSHSSPAFELSQLDPTVANWTVTDKYVEGVGSTQSKSRIQVRVTQCILQYGCYSNTYPTGTIIANKNNTATITTEI